MAKKRELLQLLSEIQWAGNIGQGAYGCPVCDAPWHADPKEKQHYKNCRLAAALRHGEEP